MLNYRKIGGIHWFRLGQLRFAWCIAKPKPVADAEPRPEPEPRPLPNINTYPIRWL